MGSSNGHSCRRWLIIWLLPMAVRGFGSLLPFFRFHSIPTVARTWSTSILLLAASSSSLDSSDQSDTTTCAAAMQTSFHHPPFLALITEPTACDSDDNLQQTLHALTQAVSTGLVDLVSVRVVAPSSSTTTTISTHDVEERIVKLVTRLLEVRQELQTDHSKHNKKLFQVVVSSDWVEAALQSGAHGVHVKESHRVDIPRIRQEFYRRLHRTPLIGTSAHSISSAMTAVQEHRPIDYLFVGTCFATLSHPEKDVLEGPELPGQVVRALQKENNQDMIPVLAIGGMDAANAHIPLQWGAHGAATIRAVLQAQDPAAQVRTIHQHMVEARVNDGDERDGGNHK